MFLLVLGLGCCCCGFVGWACCASCGQTTLFPRRRKPAYPPPKRHSSSILTLALAKLCSFGLEMILWVLIHFFKMLMPEHLVQRAKIYYPTWFSYLVRSYLIQRFLKGAWHIKIFSAVCYLNTIFTMLFIAVDIDGMRTTLQNNLT